MKWWFLMTMETSYGLKNGVFSQRPHMSYPLIVHRLNRSHTQQKRSAKPSRFIGYHNDLWHWRWSTSRWHRWWSEAFKCAVIPSPLWLLSIQTSPVSKRNATAGICLHRLCNDIGRLLTSILTIFIIMIGSTLGAPGIGGGADGAGGTKVCNLWYLLPRFASLPSRAHTLCAPVRLAATC